MCWTITIGTGKSAGSWDRIEASASGPPVEAPIAMTSTAPVGSPVRGTAVRGRTRVAGAARLVGTTRAATGADAAAVRLPVRALILGISWSRTLAMASSGDATFAGLQT